MTEECPKLVEKETFRKKDSRAWVFRMKTEDGKDSLLAFSVAREPHGGNAIQWQNVIVISRDGMKA